MYLKIKNIYQTNVRVVNMCGPNFIQLYTCTEMYMLTCKAGTLLALNRTGLFANFVDGQNTAKQSKTEQYIQPC